MPPSNRRSGLEIEGRGHVAFPRVGVPLKLIELMEGTFAVFREMFSGRFSPTGHRNQYRKRDLPQGCADAELILGKPRSTSESSMLSCMTMKDTKMNLALIGIAAPGMTQWRFYPLMGTPSCSERSHKRRLRTCSAQ
jgi:hypothetical protein